MLISNSLKEMNVSDLQDFQNPLHLVERILEIPVKERVGVRHHDIARMNNAHIIIMIVYCGFSLYLVESLHWSATNSMLLYQSDPMSTLVLLLHIVPL